MSAIMIATFRILLLAIATASSFAFTETSLNAVAPRGIYLHLKLSESAGGIEESDVDDNKAPVERASLGKKKTRMSESMPFMVCPEYLTGELAGDVGFDPLGFGKNREVLMEMREAEMKHARLAMLAAAGWPISELLDRKLASILNLSPVIDDFDRVPSFLNGGLDKVVPEFWGFCLGMCAAIDSYGVQKARMAEGEDNSDYFPGNLGFDPLKLYPDQYDPEGRRRMQLAEIKHGRLAMIGVAGFAAQEAVSKVGVVDETPFFFKPLF